MKNFLTVLLALFTVDVLEYYYPVGGWADEVLTWLGSLAILLVAGFIGIAAMALFNRK